MLLNLENTHAAFPKNSFFQIDWMCHLIRARDAKLDDLSSITGTQVVEEGNPQTCKLSSDLHKLTVASISFPQHKLNHN